MFLTGYAELVGSAQTVAEGEGIVFDDVDIAGIGVEFVAPGSDIVLTEPGLYHIEWSVNLAEGNSPALIGLLEDGETTSAMANSSTSGNVSSGAIIAVGDTPVTITLSSFTDSITLGTIGDIENISASIRIIRFADGVSTNP